MTRPAGTTITVNDDTASHARVIFLGVPSFGMVSLRWHAHVMQLQNPLNRSVYHGYVIGSEVGQARNIRVDQALNWTNSYGHTISHVFFIDDDVLVPPYALSVLLERKRPIVGGLYYAKTPAEQPLVLPDPFGGTVTDLPRNTVVECYAHGMGCTLIELQVFRDVLAAGLVGYETVNGKSIAQFFSTTRDALSQESNGANVVLNETEDVFFLKRAAQLGYRAAVDTGVFCFHWDHQGKVGYPLRLWQEFQDTGQVTIGTEAVSA
jgi:hypothetical protein